LNDHWKNYIVIEKEGELLGGTGYQMSPVGAEAQISWIFVHPDYAGKGLGKKMVRHCLQLFRSQNRIRIVTVRTSQWAYKFFEKFGFVTIRKEHDYWAKGLDLYEMNLGFQ